MAFTGRPGKPAGETGFTGRPGSPEGETPEEIGRPGSPGEATGLPANLRSLLYLKEPQPDVRENLKGQRDGQLREARLEVKTLEGPGELH